MNEMDEEKQKYRKISYEDLLESMDSGSAFRQITRLYPAGGKGSKVFPPTFAEGKYAFETRIGENGQLVQSVLLDSVQSQANRMEEALLQAIKSRNLGIGLLYTDFSEYFPDIGKISTYEVPHRIADAIFRESSLNGVPFRDTEIGQSFVRSNIRDATGLFHYCPHALIFGIWDSTGPGGMGNKFQRTVVSEIVGLNAKPGVQTSSRIDPIIRSNPSLFETSDGTWTAVPEKSVLEKNKPKKFPKKLSELNLGNVVPTIKETGGGVSIDGAVQTTVISIPALKKLRFPLDGANSEATDKKAQVVLLSLAISAVSHARDKGYDLRSRCLLVPEGIPPLELINKDGSSRFFSVDSKTADEILVNSIDQARKAGLPWLDRDVALKPNSNLIDLIRRSRELHDEEENEA